MKKTYLLMGESEGDHLFKWAYHLQEHYNLYCLTFSKFGENYHNIIGSDRLFELDMEINSTGGNYRTLFSLYKIMTIIKKIKPDIVNAHYLTSYGLIGSIIKRMMAKKFKLVCSAWGSDILVTPKKNKFFMLALKHTLRTADLITSDSKYMSHEIMKIVADSPLMYFPFGVYELPNVSLEQKDFNLFYSNRAHKKLYRIDRVIKVFYNYHLINENAYLIIANTGEEEKNLKELVISLDLDKCVEFIGYQSPSDQKEIYTKAAYYFSLPDSDSTSVSLLEAMSYGCIPIVSNIPANREWIKNRENGIIVNEDTDVSYLIPLSQSCFAYNRELIKRDALFPLCIENYVKRVNAI